MGSVMIYVATVIFFVLTANGYDKIEELPDVFRPVSVGHMFPLTSGVNDSATQIEHLRAPMIGQCSHRCLTTQNCSSVFYNSTSKDCRLFSDRFDDIDIAQENETSGAFYMNFREPAVEAPWNITGKPCTTRGCESCRHDTNGEAFCLGQNAHCAEVPSSNFKDYFFGELSLNRDSAGEGVAKEFVYTKKSNISGLRVSWIGLLRGVFLSSGAGKCTRFYFTFNGMECGSPDTIEYIHHDGAARDAHRPAEVAGICEGIPAGNITIQFRAGACSGYTVSGQGAYFGWKSNSRAFVEETDTRLGKGGRAMEVVNNYMTDAKFKSLYFPSQNTAYWAKGSFNKGMTKFTTCAWFQTGSTAASMSIISYSYTRSDGSCEGNGLWVLLKPSDKRIQVFVDGANKYGTTGQYPYNDNKIMHQVCFMWNSDGGQYRIYMDGILKDEGQGLSAGVTLPGDGIVAFGQDQDGCAGGGFASAQAFHGWLSRVNVWDYWLEPWAMGQCYSSVYGNVFAWHPSYLTVNSLSWSNQPGCNPGNIPTFGGNGNNLPCLFPYKYNGVSHQVCTNEGKERPWCSVTDDFDRDGLWGYCEVYGHGVGHVQKSVQNIYGNSYGSEPCSFPFTYSGKSYDRCTYHGGSYGTPWCYTTTGKWGFCKTPETIYTTRTNSDCGGNDLYSFAATDPGDCMEKCNMRPDCKCTAYRLSDKYCWLKSLSCDSPTSNSDRVMYDKVFRESVYRTFGGNSLEAQCIFPFIYQGVTYHTCITDNHDHPWCATTPNFDEDGKWGNCVVIGSHYMDWRQGDCGGNDIGSVHYKYVSSAEECENHCHLYPECRTSMFRPFSLKCWRKYKSCMTPSSSYNSKAIDRFEVGRFYVRRLGICTDFTISPHQGGVSYSTAEGCRFLCDSLPDCKAFYYDNNAKKCYPQSQRCENVLTSPGCSYCYMFNLITQGNKPGVFRGLPRETILEWPEPSVSTSEYAKLLIDYTPDMAAITACLWMRTRKQDGTDQYLLSYANAATIHQFFLQLVDGTTLKIYIAGTNLGGLGRVYLTDFNWHHVCFTWENGRGNWKVYIDGLVAYEGSGFNVGKTIGGGGTWILGQRQGSVGGSFSTSYSYIGHMTRVNVWDTALPSSMMTSRCEKLAGNVYAWDTNTVEIHSLRTRKEHLCSESEVPSACSALSVFNVQQYIVFNIDDAANGGDTMVMKFDYTKREERTALRVYYSGTGYSAGLKSRRWVVRFSDRPCYQGDIEGIMGMYVNSGTNSGHRTLTFDGICEGLPAGKIRIELYVDDNARDTTGASSPVAHTGWNAVNRFIVEEIRLRHDVNAFRGTDGQLYKIPVFNIHYWKFENINKNSNGLAEILSVDFTKKSSSSGLRVRWSGPLGAYGDHCGKYYFTFNGDECSNPGSIVARIHVNPTSEKFYHTVPIEGICYGFLAGKYTIALHMDDCTDIGYSGNGVNLDAGFASVSSVTVSEVNVSTD